jgi:hypothetical protein
VRGVVNCCLLGEIGTVMLLLIVFEEEGVVDDVD